MAKNRFSEGIVGFGTHLCALSPKTGPIEIEEPVSKEDSGIVRKVNAGENRPVHVPQKIDDYRSDALRKSKGPRSYM